MFGWFKKKRRLKFRSRPALQLDGFLYRPTTSADIKDFLMIERDVYKGDVPWVYSSFEFEISQNRKASFLTVERNHKIIGFVGMRIVGRNLHISNLAVLREFQRQGVASHLIAQVEKEAREMAVPELDLEVRKENRGAQALYRKQGFQSEKILERYYSDGSDAIFMVKKLDKIY